MLCDGLEGWDREDKREGIGGHVYADMADLPYCATETKYCEAIILQ